MTILQPLAPTLLQGQIRARFPLDCARYLPDYDIDLFGDNWSYSYVVFLKPDLLFTMIIMFRADRRCS